MSFLCFICLSHLRHFFPFTTSFGPISLSPSHSTVQTLLGKKENDFARCLTLTFYDVGRGSKLQGAHKGGFVPSPSPCLSVFLSRPLHIVERPCDSQSPGDLENDLGWQMGMQSPRPLLDRISFREYKEGTQSC